MSRRTYVKIFRDWRNVDIAIDMLNKDVSYSRIAAYFNVDHSSVISLFKRLGLYEKGRNGHNKISDNYHKIHDEFVAEWVKLYNDGWTLERIGDKFNRSKQSICLAFKRKGIDITRKYRNRKLISAESYVDFDGSRINPGMNYADYLRIEKQKKNDTVQNTTTRKDIDESSELPNALDGKEQDSERVSYFSITF